MQSIPEISDLNYYRDATHYNTDIQTIYADGIISGKYDIKNINDIKQSKLELDALIKQFESENKDWI
jgi:hypothetical protein